MKGIIFNLLEQFISDNFGEERYEEILASCPLVTQEPFVGPGTYPDEDFLKLTARAVESLALSAPDALRAFGKYCFPKLAEKFPGFVSPHKDPKSFLMTVDGVIHVEVRKLFDGASVPNFVYREPSRDTLIIEYSSERKFCHFMEGLIDGVGAHYNVPIQRKQTRCMLNRDPVCEFHLNFNPIDKEHQ